MTYAPIDPIKFGKLYWPHVEFYDRQREVIYSVQDNVETLVTAGNKLGKDFLAGFVALWYFMTHHPVRVVTTSVKDDHLRVLWGEIGRFIDTAVIPLTVEKGGNLVVNHRDVKKVVGGNVCKISYLRGMVSGKGEGMAGHHAAYTLMIVDEASGVDDEVYEQGQGWMKRLLAIGNPNECRNWFRKLVDAGDLERKAS